MARRKKGGASKRDYLTALRYFDITASPRMTKSQLKKLYIKARKEQKAKDNAELPRIDKIVEQQLANEAHQEFAYEETLRGDDMRTETPQEPIEKASEVIEEFLNSVETVYRNTYDYIDTLPAPTKYGKGNFGTAEGYFLANSIDEMESSYNSILNMIEAMRGENHSNDVLLANALAQNKDLDYTRALIFVPPSGVQNNFEATVEMLEGIARAIFSEIGGI